MSLVARGLGSSSLVTGGLGSSTGAPAPVVRPPAPAPVPSYWPAPGMFELVVRQPVRKSAGVVCPTAAAHATARAGKAVGYQGPSEDECVAVGLFLLLRDRLQPGEELRFHYENGRMTGATIEQRAA